ncbi:hypothetical protein BU15DRAFT_69966 [Melanogaster broomeanus]|nr:hypothetical protein BU15DRAFT_69966 [Melanogaster broomeanus]
MQDSKKTAPHQSRARVKTTQLLTPATSARQRAPSTRNIRHVEGPFGKTHPAGAIQAFVQEEPIVFNEIDLIKAASKATPLKVFSTHCEESEREMVEAAAAQSLATPSSSNRPRRLTRVGLPRERELHRVHQSSRLSDTGLPTPVTGLRKTHVVEEQSPSTDSSRLHQQPSAVSGSSPSPGSPQRVLSLVNFSAQSTEGITNSRVHSDSPDPLHHEDNPFAPPVEQGPSMHRSAPKGSHVTSLANQLSPHPPKVLNIPVNPVPSSQSQYLLHIDATPKHKRISRRADLVPSSQTQEESELTKSVPPLLIPASAMRKLSVGESHGMNRTDTRTPRPGRSKRKSQHVYTLGSTPITSPVTPSGGASCSFLATKKSLDELSFFKSPSRRRKMSACRSPGRKTGHGTSSPRKPAREDSIENVPPAPEDESMTESESEMGIFLLKEKDKSSMPELPSPGIKASPFRSQTAYEPSSTEAESDTDILRCVAGIGKKRARQLHASLLMKDGPSLPVISPLVSPARSRIAVEASFAGSTQFLAGEGAGLSVPATYTSPSRAFTRRRLPASSDSVPSVVRDFVEMFQGDGSYPEDFPESLRI